MSDFSSMNEVYATFFRENPLARTTVAVADLPEDALLEIEATAVECLDPGELALGDFPLRLLKNRK